MNTDKSPLYRCPDGNAVRFYEVPVPNAFLSEQEGRPVYFRATMMDIISPGMKNQMHVQEINLKDQNGVVVKRAVAEVQRGGIKVYIDQIFKDQIRAWQDGVTTTDALGTPLDMYPKLDVAQIASLKAQNIMSLEAFAAVPDSNLQTLNIGPKTRECRDGVIAFLNGIKGKSAAEAENKDLREKMAAMEAQLAEFMEAQRLAATVIPNVPKKRGPKPRGLNPEAKVEPIVS